MSVHDGKRVGFWAPVLVLAAAATILLLPCAVLATLALGLTASQNAGAAFQIRTEDRIAAAHVADGLVERGVLALILALIGCGLSWREAVRRPAGT